MMKTSNDKNSTAPAAAAGATTTSPPSWSPFLQALTGVQTKPLGAPGEIEAAKKLLYQVYHVEYGWDPNPSNPSGLHMAKDSQMCEDTIDADWFGVFQKGQLVAVARVVAGPQLEFMRYLDDSAQKVLWECVQDRISTWGSTFSTSNAVTASSAAAHHRQPPAVCELNRLAVLPHVRGSMLISLYMGFATAYFAQQCGATISVGTASPKLARVYEQRYGAERLGLSMKYDPFDDCAAEFVLYRLDFSPAVLVLRTCFFYFSWKLKTLLFGKS